MEYLKVVAVHLFIPMSFSHLISDGLYVYEGLN